jgi:protein-tyrosine-phosphatase
VLFVCLHGSAKSQVAAAHLRRLAAARGRTIVTSTAGIEPDDEVPPRVVAGLRADGLDPIQAVPRSVTEDSVRAANLIVSFGCEVPIPEGLARTVIRWDDVPAVSDGYDAARTEIVRRVGKLLDELLPE